MKLGQLFLSLVLTAVGQATAIAATVRTVSLDELRAHPRAYAGRTVRVSGQLNICWNMDCALCPLEATSANPMSERCLAIAFDPYRGGDDDYGARMEPLFRYADVVVTAKFDPSCLEGPCLDRASVLLDAKVEKVTRRRRSEDGLIPSAEDFLTPPSEAAKTVSTLLRAFTKRDYPNPVRIYAMKSDPSASLEAVACISWTVPGQVVRWPTNYTTAVLARSTEDTYRCWHAFRDKQGWALEPGW